MSKNTELITIGHKVGMPRPVQFHLPTLMASGLVIHSMSGGGKSRLIRKILEESYGLVQQSVLDLEGEFSSLRSHFPDYVIAGKGGDVEITIQQKMPQLLAIKLLELKVSSICDLYEVKKHDRVKFVRLFLEAVMEAPKNLYHPVLFVLDEAHHFCPQVGEAESYNAVIDLCARGRKRGFRPILATQRLSKLHKDAVAELGNKMIGRTGLDIDQKRAADELDMGKSDRLNLRNLKPGEFYVFGPALRVDGEPESGVVLCKVGAVKSATDDHSVKQMLSVPPAGNAIKRIVASLADLPAEAEQKARTEEDLRKEISNLKRQLSDVKQSTDIKELELAKAHIEKLRRRIKMDRADMAQVLESLSKQQETISSQVRGLEVSVQVIGRALAAELAKDRSDDDRQALSIDLPQALTPQDRWTIKSISDELDRRDRGTVASTKVPPGPANDLNLSSGPQKVLNVLADFESVKISPLPKVVVGYMVGVNGSGSTLRAWYADLVKYGLIEYPSAGMVQLTGAGRVVAQPQEIPTTLEDYQRRCLNTIERLCGQGPASILRILLKHPHHTFSKADIGESIGVEPSGSTLRAHFADLSNIGAVTYPTKGHVKVSKLLFPEGLQ